MSDFCLSRPSMGDAELAALREVLASGWITTGPKNQARSGILPADRQPSCDCRQFSDRRDACDPDGAGYWPRR